jgi:hypothetical protein
MTWRPFPRRYIAMQVRMVLLVSFVTAAVAFALLVVAFTMLSDGPVSPPVVIGFSLMFAAIVASCACLVALARIARYAHARVDGEFPHRSEITDVVMRGRHCELDLDDRVLAAKYAVALLPYLAFHQAQLILLCAAVLLSQVAVASAAADGPSPATIGAIVVVLAAAVAGAAHWLAQSRRVHHFLDENRQLLGAPSARA